MAISTLPAAGPAPGDTIPPFIEEEEKTLGDYLAVLKRRKKVGLLTAFTLLVVSLAVAILLPPVYKSDATILIEQQEIPQDLVRTTITSFADQRIQIISQRVMTTSNLSSIIEKYGLYQELREKEPLEVVIAKMTEDIHLDMVSADVVDPRSGRPSTATIAFSLGYESKSADTAQKVANELVTLYLNENLKSRTEQTEQASIFLADEAEKLAQKVAELEKTLAVFKEENAGRLPELNDLNIQLMNRTETELTDVERQIRTLQERQIYLQAQLAQINPNSTLYSETGERILSPVDRLKGAESALIAAQAHYEPTHPDVIRLKREIEALQKETGKTGTRDSIETQLFAARTELASLQEKYTDDHPDIKRLKRTIEMLEQDVKRAPVGIPRPVLEEADNPAYIQLQAQLEATNTEMASLKTKADGLSGKFHEFEQRLTETPQVEREYRALVRDYETAYAKYKEITAKQMEAKLAQSLETERKGERFTLIEPPLLPEKPTKPNRLAIALLGTIMAFAGGLASVFAADAADSAIHGRQGIIEVIGKAPLAMIPIIEIEAKDVLNKKKTIRTLLIVFAVAAVFFLAAFIVHALVMPLDVFWFRSLRKIGFV